MQKYIISDDDIYNNFFHFTEERNLSNVEKYGLQPKIGVNAKYIEKNKKVFFVEGLDNYLILFDCWINCFYYIPVIPLIYKLGAFFLHQKWFPMVIADSYFAVLKKSKLQEKLAFKRFAKALNDNVVLKLDLKENEDFKYNDIDEIKAKGYKKRHLVLMGYSPEYSQVDVPSMDKWNLHTLKNHGVEAKKIKMCFLDNGQYKLWHIFNLSLAKTKLNLEKTCPVLSKFLKSSIYAQYFDECVISKMDENFLASIGINIQEIKKVEELIIDGVINKLYDNKHVPYHNLGHAERVIIYALWITNEMRLKGSNIDNEELLLTACLYHDCGRNWNLFLNHGVSGAKRARKILKYRYDEKFLNMLELLIETHASKEDKVNFKDYKFSKNAQENIQVLSNILKDADALDRNRIKQFKFAQCNPTYLRTKEAKIIFKESDTLYDAYMKASR